VLYRESSVLVEEALQAFKSNVPTEDGDSMVTVCRSRLLASAFDAMRRPAFSCFKNLKLEFSGEDAEDIGGPRIEFFQ